MSVKKYIIENLLFDVPGVVNYNTKKYIEVQPGVMTPLVINVKETLNDYGVRFKIVKALAELVSPKSVCICGIESGGSYYGSAVADILKKPLVLFRKGFKEYGLNQRFVGALPEDKNALVTIIDDVIGEGKISTAAVTELKRAGYEAEVCAIFSYLPEMKLFMSKIKITYLSDIEGLCQVGMAKRFFSENDVKLIRKECSYSSK